MMHDSECLAAETASCEWPSRSPWQATNGVGLLLELGQFPPRLAAVQDDVAQAGAAEQQLRLGAQGLQHPRQRVQRADQEVPVVRRVLHECIFVSKPATNIIAQVETS